MKIKSQLRQVSEAEFATDIDGARVQADYHPSYEMNELLLTFSTGGKLRIIRGPNNLIINCWVSSPLPETQGELGL